MVYHYKLLAVHPPAYGARLLLTAWTIMPAAP